MTNRVIIPLLALFLLFACPGVYAADIRVTNPLALPEAGSSPAVQKCAFDIQWDDSWSNDTNHDAAWVAIKYSVDGGKTWAHGSLGGCGINPAGFSVGKGTDIEIIVPDDRTGAIIRRREKGNGRLSVKNIVLPFLPTERNPRGQQFKIKIIALEMVSVPEGPFCVGDPRGPDGPKNCFYTRGTNTAYRISSEEAIPVGTMPGNLFYDRDTEFNGDQAGIIPPEFPKGYAAFYCMKYEVTQGQYRDFLNTLTPSQQARRCMQTVEGKFMNPGPDTALPQYRNGIQKQDREYVCNLHSDSRYNAADDGEYIPCNWVNWADLTAFADWAGLRPMTELEFEKACQDIPEPVPAQEIRAPGTIRESISPPGANCAFGNHPAVQGPVKSGSSGAGTWGIHELSGNLWERVITVGNPEGRRFDGRHGNGILAENGDADVLNWPGTEETGSGFRGGSWRATREECLAADRSAAAHTNTREHNRYITHGMRCARTAPLTGTPEKNEDFRFIVMGALHLGLFPDEPYEGIIEQIRQKKADFLILVGGGIDMKTERTPAALWKKFDTFREKLGIPVYCTYGPGLNRDIRASLEQMTAYDREFLNRFPGKYFSFVHKNNLFIFLDTADPGLYNTQEKTPPASNQYVFLKDTVSGNRRYQNVFIASTHSRWLETHNEWNAIVHPLIREKAGFVFGDNTFRILTDTVDNTTYLSLGFLPGRGNLLEHSFPHFLTVDVAETGVSLSVSTPGNIPLGSPQNFNQKVAEYTLSDFPLDPRFTLTSPDREAILEPDRVVKTMNIKPGMRVLDVGAGTGFFTFRLADALHNSGAVFATEIQSDLVRHLEEKTREKKYTNVFPVQVSTEAGDPFYKNRLFDIILLCEILNDLPNQEPLLKVLRSCLVDKTGRLYVINYRPVTDFHEIDFGDFGKILRTFRREKPDFPVLLRMNKAVRELSLAPDRDSIPPSLQKQTLADFNAMLADPTLFRDIVNYYASQKKLIRSVTAHSLCRPSQVDLVKWLVSHLEAERAFDSPAGKLSARAREEMHTLNKILLSNIFGLEKTAFLRGENIGIAYLDTDDVISRLEKIGFTLVKKHEFLSQFYFLEFKR